MNAPFDVVTFGEVLWDFFQVSDGAAERSGVDTYLRFVGGASGNVAVRLARQGLRVAPVAGIGRDRFGDELAQRLESVGVDTRFLVRLPERTAVTFISRDADGEPFFMNYRHGSANMALSAHHVAPAMANATWVHFGASTLGVENRAPLGEATRAFDAHALEHRALKSIDLNARPHLWASPVAAVEELRQIAPGSALVKASLADLAALDIDVADLLELAPGCVVIVTRGAGEATAYGAHGEASLAPEAVACVDATGAGDAFTAGVLACLIAKRLTPSSPQWRDASLWMDVLARGHSLGARAVSQLGGT